MDYSEKFCDHCGGKLGTTIYSMVWYGVVYAHCSASCKNVHKAKLQAEQNLTHVSSADQK